MRNLIVVLIAVSVLAAVAASAQTCAPDKPIRIWGRLDVKPHIAQDYKPESVVIGIGAYQLFELKTAAAGYTLAEREVAVYNRLVEILSYGPVNPKSIRVCYTRSSPSIFIGPYLFLTVYARDAVSYKTTQDELAKRWRNRMAEVLPKIAPIDTVARTMPELAPANDTPLMPGEKPPTKPATTVKPAPVAKPVTPVVVTPAAPVEPAAPGEVYEVGVGSYLLFRLRDKDGYASLDARGAAAETAIVEVLSRAKTRDIVATAVAVGSDWQVVWDGVKVIRVTPTDAKLAGMNSPQALALAWAQALNKALPKIRTATTGG
jgi:hypothetical protein